MFIRISSKKRLREREHHSQPIKMDLFTKTPKESTTLTQQKFFPSHFIWPSISHPCTRHHGWFQHSIELPDESRRWAKRVGGGCLVHSTGEHKILFPFFQKYPIFAANNCVGFIGVRSCPFRWTLPGIAVPSLPRRGFIPGDPI